MKVTLTSLIAASVFALTGSYTLAQTSEPVNAPAPDGKPSDTMRPGAQGAMQKRMEPARRQEMMATRHAALKSKLKIAPDQEGAWTNFTEALKPTAKTQPVKPSPTELADLTTPERIDRMRNLRKEHWTAMQAEMDKRDEATKTFYNSLSAEQKKTFDAEHARMGHRHERHQGSRHMKGASAPK